MARELLFSTLRPWGSLPQGPRQAHGAHRPQTTRKGVSVRGCQQVLFMDTDISMSRNFQVSQYLVLLLGFFLNSFFLTFFPRVIEIWLTYNFYQLFQTVNTILGSQASPKQEASRAWPVRLVCQPRYTSSHMCFNPAPPYVDNLTEYCLLGLKISLKWYYRVCLLLQPITFFNTMVAKIYLSCNL